MKKTIKFLHVLILIAAFIMAAAALITMPEESRVIKKQTIIQKDVMVADLMETDEPINLTATTIDITSINKELEDYDGFIQLQLKAISEQLDKLETKLNKRIANVNKKAEKVSKDVKKLKGSIPDISDLEAKKKEIEQIAQEIEAILAGLQGNSTNVQEDIAILRLRLMETRAMFADEIDLEQWINQ